MAKKYFIIRPGWMFGGGKKDKKFVSYILKQISQGSKSLNVVNDKFGTPTYTFDLARNIEALIQTNDYGVYHAVCKGETNRVEMAKEILKVLNREDISITEVDSEFFKKDFSVPRANCESLITGNLDSIGLNLMRDWREAINHYIATDWKDMINFRSELN